MHKTIIIFMVLEVPRKQAVGSGVIRNTKNAMDLHDLEIGGEGAAGSTIIRHAFISRLSEPCPIAHSHSKPIIFLVIYRVCLLKSPRQDLSENSFAW